jgi:hypothetical protein
MAIKIFCSVIVVLLLACGGIHAGKADANGRGGAPGLIAAFCMFAAGFLLAATLPFTI